MNALFNDRLKQVIFVSILILLTGVALFELSAYLPGILGAVTLYILCRESYFQNIFRKKWKPGWTSALFVLYYFLLFGLPIFLGVTLLAPKINAVISNSPAIIATVKSTLLSIQHKVGFSFTSEKTINNAVDKSVAMLPSLFNTTANLVSNLAIMLFLLYYMLYSGSLMEKTLFRIIPLRDDNTRMLAFETKQIVKANAIGIPLIACIQGATAALGYYIFGVNDVALWGFFTGVFSFFPIVGSMLIWVPLCIYMYTTGNSGMATGLLLYSVIVTSNIDYIARITIMKKMGDAHPVITLLGIIVGLNLFGFVGLIFGPLLVNYIVVLFNIYVNEYVENPTVLPVTDEDGTKNSL